MAAKRFDVPESPAIVGGVPGPCRAQPAHSVWLSTRPRPELCRASVQVSRMPATSVSPRQSSAVMRSSGTPQASRWALTPSGTT